MLWTWAPLWLLVVHRALFAIQKNAPLLPDTLPRTEILPYKQANSVAYQSVMDGGRRHETSGPETKDFITHRNSGVSAFSWNKKSPFSHNNGKRWHLHRRWIYYRRGSLNSGNLNVLEWSGSLPALSSTEIILLLSKAVYYTHSSKDNLE